MLQLLIYVETKSTHIIFINNFAYQDQGYIHCTLYTNAKKIIFGCGPNTNISLFMMIDHFDLVLRSDCREYDRNERHYKPVSVSVFVALRDESVPSFSSVQSGDQRR